MRGCAVYLGTCGGQPTDDREREAVYRDERRNYGFGIALGSIGAGPPDMLSKLGHYANSV